MLSDPADGAGRPAPGVDVQIHDDSGAVVPPAASGELFVRGEQGSGRYADIGSGIDETRLASDP
jgi:acyl-coenzyme A synthetase/AMP-(fatty) acid ligase